MENYFILFAPIFEVSEHTLTPVIPCFLSPASVFLGCFFFKYQRYLVSPFFCSHFISPLSYSLPQQTLCEFLYLNSVFNLTSLLSLCRLLLLHDLYL